MRLIQILRLTQTIIVVSLLCVCGASARQTTIATTYAGVNMAAAAFEGFDAKHIQDLVVAAPDKATGEASLQAYAAKQAEVKKLVVAAYQAIAAAALANDGLTLSNMIQVGLQLQTALKTLGVQL